MADKVDKKKKAPPFPAVQLVSLWALLTAGVFIALAYSLPRSPPPSWTRLPLMTDDAEFAAVVYAWCMAAQSATAAVALLLPGRRRLCRRALAYAALVAATANHAMFATEITLVAGADPGRVAFWFWILGGIAIVSMLAAGDHICFLALIGKLESAMGSISDDHFSS